MTSVQTQVVAGTNYMLVFEAATQAQELHTFEATVYGKPSMYCLLLCDTLNLSGPMRLVRPSSLDLLCWSRDQWCYAEPLGKQDLKLSNHKLLPKDEVSFLSLAGLPWMQPC